MRVFSMICVMVVLVLNFVPCADLHEDSKAETSFAIADHHNDTSTADNCTPFCHCSCCASTVVVKIFATPSVPFNITFPSYILHFEGDAKDVSLPIFQPPKIG